jgi:hypothetical protein
VDGRRVRIGRRWRSDGDRWRLLGRLRAGQLLLDPEQHLRRWERRLPLRQLRLGAMFSHGHRRRPAIYGVAMPTYGYLVNVTSDGTTYCAIVPSVTAFTIPLTTLRSQCWSSTGIAFDPATMPITDLQLQLRTGAATEPYDICVSQFTIS